MKNTPILLLLFIIPLTACQSTPIVVTERVNTPTEGSANAPTTLPTFDPTNTTTAIPPTTTPTVRPSTTPTKTPTPILLWEDNFNDPNSGWEIGKFADGAVGYGSGYYYVKSTQDSMTIWGVAGKNFSDTVIDVGATQITSPESNNNDYGVVCRVQPNGDGYYLLISGDGYYSIFIADGDTFIPLVDWSKSSFIKQGNSLNYIHATCTGTRLELIVNGEILAEATDSTFSSGDIAMTATTYEDETVEVHFDNVVVYKPN